MNLSSTQSMLSSLARNFRVGFVWTKIGLLKKTREMYPYVDIQNMDVATEELINPDLVRSVELVVHSGDLAPASGKMAGRVAELLILDAASRLDQLLLAKLELGSHSSGVVTVQFQSFAKIQTDPSNGTTIAALGYNISVEIHSIQEKVIL